MKVGSSDLPSLVLALSLIPASIALALTPSWLSLPVALALTTAHLALRGPEATLGVVRFLATFLAVFVATSSAAQLALAGAVDLALHYEYSLRATSLAMASSLIVGYLRPVAVLRVLTRISPDLAVALAISLKLLREYPRLWRDLQPIYALNLRGHRWARLKATILSTRALSSSSVHLSLQVAEVLASSPTLRRFLSSWEVR